MRPRELEYLLFRLRVVKACPDHRLIGPALASADECNACGQSLLAAMADGFALLARVEMVRKGERARGH